ncbi:DnaB-like helicase C-terminal domain-containing protein [Nocardia farcinica]|uniref:DnaB-like helicase C-terminal domain-containing protein n=1 Tax=Nocardia farcinica TaxID=37329 RepID=UPI0023DDF944|nr:AAA family ATPase [Nocardia farcinica]
MTQSALVRGSAGEPLPTVWHSLAAQGTVFRQGQLNLICAGPGTGKSAFALSYALQSEVPTLYFSADSDAFTQLTRSISNLVGLPLEESARHVLEGNLAAYAADLEKVPIRLSYDASPSLDTIESLMESYEEVYGDYPALVIVDNVTNVRAESADGDDPFSGLESLMDYFHTMARQTEACTWGLHHVTGKYNDANEPIPLSGVKGQITRVPEMVLTLHKRTSAFGQETLCVSTVKNRGGKADASGATYAELEFVGDTMQIRDATSAPNVDTEQDFDFGS